jgi:hypothetical protein
LLYAKGFFLFNNAYKFFTIYLGVVSFLITIVKYTFDNQIDNIFLVHIYILIRFICLSLFFKEIITNLKFKKAIKIILALFVLIILTKVALNFKMVYHFDLFESFASTFFIAVYSIYYAYQQINQKKEFYYINLSIIIYSFGGSLFYLTSSLFEKAHYDFLRVSLNVNFLFVILANMVFLIEWKKNYAKPNSK